MASAITTTDHNEIRAWVERNNGHPARVRGVGGDGDVGILRIDFDEEEDSLERIDWDEWFDAFDENQLALLHAPDSRFNKLVSRDNAN